MDKPPYLTLVNSDHEYEREFPPLPFYPFDQRPDTLPLDVDEAATAIHMALNLPAAARLLKVPLIRLTRLLRAHPRLQRVLEEANALLVHEAAAEYAQALTASDDRRREWAASKIMASRAAQGHPFSPAPPNASTSLTIASPDASRKITFRWRTDADAPTEDVG